MDLRVREMTEADLDDVAEIRVRGWQFAYRGLMPQSYLDAMSPEADAAARRKRWADPRPGAVGLVAEREGRVIGFAAFGPTRDEDLAAGAHEVYALYVHPDGIGTGAGRALMDESLDRCRTAGVELVVLWVLIGNHRARRFYERAGFGPDGTSTAYDVDGVAVPEVRYARRLGGPPAGDTAPRGSMRT
ncbi:GNAT family N-acetyltransferase [Streptomyces sp. TRM66268-LWL]|uniref:GNAT family N-acetyltransferase n=1 Tax=Streptomyces polyasparticus TaxID=2767826 RepID=A0ABR7SEC5_9ACTN|nr:GNAT family N-acetyltransferase [Streptomyces polyasparticus]MBC9713327.1 GNAT family N-acetyltransferase [Streptomyces polyasparticus]